MSRGAQSAFSRRSLWVLGAVVLAMVLLYLGGFRGMLQHVLQHKKQVQPAESALTPPVQGVDLLHNAFLDIGNRQRDYTVVFFLSKDCPLCKNYRPLIHQLYMDYSTDPRFGFVVLRTDVEKAVDSAWFIPDEYAAGKAATSIARYYGATVTPEVFVLDNQNKYIYRGAIDDWAYETGKHKREAEFHYLRDVLSQLKKGIRPRYSEHKPYGCYIE